MTTDVLYSTSNLLVERRLASSSQVCVVSFTPWTKSPPGAPFAATYLQSREVSGIFFRSLHNDWWDTPDVSAAIDIVLPLLRRFDRCVAYGSSMGAFGAIAFAARLGCQAVIAISPQAAIDRSIVPWETRWACEAAARTYALGNAGSHTTKFLHVALIYDPWYEPDKKHVELIEHESIMRGAVVQRIPFGFAGHPASKVLLETGLLKDIIGRLIVGFPLNKQMIMSYRKQRKLSRSFYDSFGTNRDLFKRHPRLALRAFEGYQNLFSKNERLVYLNARILVDQQRYAEAISALQTVEAANGTLLDDTRQYLLRLTSRFGD